MPINSDGCDSESGITETLSENVSNANIAETEISAASVEFRGFIKIPCVRIVRTDITPYINGRKNTGNCGRKHRENGLKSLTKYGPHSQKLAQKCMVTVKRDDLAKLMACYRRDSTDSSVQPSDMTLQCNICFKHYDSEKKLQNHQENKHIILNKSKKRVSFSDYVIIHEVKEYHKCRKCPKIFDDFKVLKAHMRKNHRKRKCYICNYCDKQFVDRMFFKVHIRLHCDVCGELLPNKSKFNDHRKNVCKVFKLHKCKRCKLSFFRIMDLKDHSYEHSDVMAVCDICKEHFSTKCGVAHHISFLHSKRRPISLYETHKVGNERLYICNFCEESSVEKDIIENHGFKLPDLTNKAMTGYKDYYFCDQCMRHFKTETEMLNHKWTHFLNKLEQPANSPKGILKRHNFKAEKIKYKTRYSLENRLNETRNSIENQLFENQLKDNQCRDQRLFNVNDKLPRLRKALIKLERMKIPINVKVGNGTESLNGKVAFPIIESLLNTRPDTLADETTAQDGVEPGEINGIEEEEEMDITEFLEVEFRNKNSKDESVRKRKTLLSKFQCETCGKYFSSNYCLNRHISTQHFDMENLRCNICEESFVWPSLLKSHKCIRLNHAEMPFDDARPEIRFDNEAIHTMSQIDGLEIDDNYTNAVDFEIPAPAQCDSNFSGVDQLQNLGYKIVMQEVPIEF